MTTLYEKRGRRYIPVRDDRIWDSWPQGFHLVYCKPGSRAVRFSINEDKAEVEATLMRCEDAIADTIRQAMQMRPTTRPVTKKQRAAWEAFAAAMGKDGYVVEYASIGEIAERVIDRLRDEVKR